VQYAARPLSDCDTGVSVRVTKIGQAARHGVAAAGVCGALIALGFGVGSALGAAPRAARRSVSRCAVLSRPAGVHVYFPKRLGIYIAAGSVSCAEGEQLIRRAFTVAGTPTGAGDMARYPGGWTCGGQMGSYECLYPYSRAVNPHFTEEVIGLDCTARPVGCPTRTTAYLPWRRP
jgi:hypothetical protein